MATAEVPGNRCSCGSSRERAGSAAPRPVAPPRLLSAPPRPGRCPVAGAWDHPSQGPGGQSPARWGGRAPPSLVLTPLMSTSTCRAPAPPAATSCPELASWEGDLTHRASLCLRLLGGRPVTLLPQMLLIRAQGCSQGQGRAADTEDSLEQSSGAGTGQVDRAHRFWGVLGLPALKHPPQAWPGPR